MQRHDVIDQLPSDENFQNLFKLKVKCTQYTQYNISIESYF